ncbi:MAG TPA: hypothetical protein VK453_23770 [Micromonosporaceae bacterium]|nr:hypothetical protein [Micromonosporaceae bacterium]
MIWWIVGGVVAAALLFLVVVVLRLLGGVRELSHVERALQRRVTDAQAVQESLAELGRRAEALREPLLDAQERVALIQARRGAAER